MVGNVVDVDLSSHADHCASYRAGSSATINVGAQGARGSTRPVLDPSAQELKVRSLRRPQRYCGQVRAKSAREKLLPVPVSPPRRAVDVGPHRRRPRRKRGAHRRVCGHPSRLHGAAPARARCDDGADAPRPLVTSAPPAITGRHAPPDRTKMRGAGSVRGVRVETLAAHCRPRMTPRVALEGCNQGHQSMASTTAVFTEGRDMVRPFAAMSLVPRSRRGRETRTRARRGGVGCRPSSPRSAGSRCHHRRVDAGASRRG